MYAIIESGGKQFLVREGDEVEVELLQEDSGSSYTFDKVLLFHNGIEAKVGLPYLTDCRVEGSILGTAKGPKVIAFKYKKRKSFQRKVGHRQTYSKVKITKIGG